MPINDLIADLAKASAPCRKLDARIVATVLAPKGWVLGTVEDIDGWEIRLKPQGGGKTVQWLCAADVLYVTRYLDACTELMQEASRPDAAAISARAFQALTQDASGLSPADFSGLLARRLMMELLSAIEGECSPGGRQAA
jgi:hypothetical protein